MTVAVASGAICPSELSFNVLSPILSSRVEGVMDSLPVFSTETDMVTGRSIPTLSLENEMSVIAMFRMSVATRPGVVE